LIVAAEAAVPLLEQIAALVGARFVTGAQQLRERPRSRWDPSPLEALGLVRPANTGEVSSILRMCHAVGQPVVVHGGLTGLVKGDRTTPRDLILSLERLQAIEEIDVIGRTVTVQAGCTLQTLRDAVQAKGLLLPLDLGARGSCTIGGNVATNAGGLNVIRYGMVRANVLGLEAVLADGTVVSSMNRMLKNNSGYDLKQLFIGTEGTLGVVTRIVLALKEQPGSVSTALVAIEQGRHLVEFLHHMDRRLGGTLTAFEAMWQGYYRTNTAGLERDPPLSRDHPYYVIVEGQGADAEVDDARFTAAVEAALASGLIVDAVLPKSESERERLWAIREHFNPEPGLRPFFSYDVSLPLRDMLVYVDEVRRRLQQQWSTMRLLVVGHFGDGNLHFIVSPGASGVGDREALHAASDRCVYEPLQRYGGAISAEHGIGLDKKAWLPISRSAEEIELMRLLKRSLDPKGILNPGKVIDV
jgi:FAD/FMN-containing dehydrogenase